MSDTIYPLLKRIPEELNQELVNKLQTIDLEDTKLWLLSLGVQCSHSTLKRKYQSITGDPYIAEKLIPDIVFRKRSDCKKLPERIIKTFIYKEGEAVTCEICKKQFSMLNNAHLSTHNLTPQEYLVQFPGSELMSEQSRKNISNTRKERFASGEIVHWNLGQETSQETKDRIRATNKGQQHTPEQRKRWEQAMKEVRASPDYVPSMLGKIHSEETRKLLSIASTNTNVKVQEDTLERIQVRMLPFNLNVLSRDKGVFTVHCSVCDTVFTRVKSVLVLSKIEHYDGEYCPTCFPVVYNGYWNFKNFERNPEGKLIPGEIYLLRMFSETEEFLKIGITIHCVDFRYKGFNEYQIEIIKSANMTIFEAFTREQKIISELSEFRYYPDIKFAGHTECLEYSELDTILEMIYSKSPSL